MDTQQQQQQMQLHQFHQHYNNHQLLLDDKILQDQNKKFKMDDDQEIMENRLLKPKLTKISKNKKINNTTIINAIPSNGLLLENAINMEQNFSQYNQNQINLNSKI
jgi:hypothetical protein